MDPALATFLDQVFPVCPRVLGHLTSSDDTAQDEDTLTAPPFPQNFAELSPPVEPWKHDATAQDTALYDPPWLHQDEAEVLLVASKEQGTEYWQWDQYDTRPTAFSLTQTPSSSPLTYTSPSFVWETPPLRGFAQDSPYCDPRDFTTVVNQIYVPLASVAPHPSTFEPAFSPSASTISDFPIVSAAFSPSPRPFPQMAGPSSRFDEPPPAKKPKSAPSGKKTFRPRCHECRLKHATCKRPSTGSCARCRKQGLICRDYEDSKATFLPAQGYPTLALNTNTKQPHVDPALEHP